MDTALKSASLFSCMLGAALVLTTSTACADPSPALDRISLWLGGHYAETDLSLSASNSNGDISTGEVKLDHGHDDGGRARLDFLAFDNQGFTFDYYALSHSTNQVLNAPFDYASNHYELDSTLHSKFNFSAGSVSYHWWFGHAADVFGVGLGATHYRAKLGIDGTASLNGDSASANAAWDANAVAPTVTAAYKHAFSDQLRVYLDASGVKKNGGALSGHIYDARAGVEWFPWHNVGLGAEYGATRIKLWRNANSYVANLDIRLDGPSLFLRMRF